MGPPPGSPFKGVLMFYLLPLDTTLKKGIPGTLVRGSNNEPPRAAHARNLWGLLGAFKMPFKKPYKAPYTPS